MFRSFFKRIADDLKQKKLIPLKILCFVHSSTQLVLYPYLTIHMRELGINVEETAFMSSITPLFFILIPPLAGLFADKIGNFRFLLALSSSFGGLLALLLLLVPVGRITVTYPTDATLLTSCESSRLRLQHVSQYPCHSLRTYTDENYLNIVTCGFICDTPIGVASDKLDTLLSNTKLYDINFQSDVKSNRILYRNIYNPLSISDYTRKNRDNIRILKNDPYFNTTITKVSNTKYFFPAPQLYKMKCTYVENNATCILGMDEISSDFEDDRDNNYHVRISPILESTQVQRYSINSIVELNETALLDYFGSVDSTTCVDKFTQTQNDETVWVQVGSKRFTKCVSACAATAPRESLCDNTQEKVELDPAFTFWSYMAVRVIIGIVSGTSFAMFEGAAIAIIREHRADYGLQKVYGSLGGIISSPLSGMLIDYASRGKGYIDFRPAFYMYAILKVLSGALMMTLDLEFKKPAKTLVKDVVTVFRNFEIVALLIACVVMGTAWGYLENFLFWFLQDLGASQSLMGITITVGGIAGLPLLILSGPIIKRIGHTNVLFIGFIFYAIRLFGYSFIYNPWLSLIFETMESVTLALSYTAAVTYAALLSSTTTDTSVQGLLGGLYYGVGKGAGSLTGGYLMKYVGTRLTFRIFAGATFITGCIYWIFNRLCIQKRVMARENITSKKNRNSLDIECHETHINKNINSTDDVTNYKTTDSYKLTPDTVDGSSDSGVDNPSYVDNEAESVNGVSKDDRKVKI